MQALICCVSALLLTPALAQLAPAPPAPGYLNNGPYGLATFQMSTGVNITVSVVIAAALAVAIIAGYIRIRRQRRAHRAYLRTRAQVLAIAEAEAAAADSEPMENMDPLHVPFLVLMPDAKDLCIAQVDGRIGHAKQEDGMPAQSERVLGRTGSTRLSPQQEEGRQLANTWLREWGGVDRIWAQHVAHSLTAELETRRRRRKKAIPLFVAILQHKTEDPDPDALEFVVHEDVMPEVPPGTAAAATPAPEAPPPFAFGFLRRWRRGRGGAAGPAAGSTPVAPGGAQGASSTGGTGVPERVVEMRAAQAGSGALGQGSGTAGQGLGTARQGSSGLARQRSREGGPGLGRGDDIV